MHGAIAAGSTATAETGAEVLRRGGNAVDAAVAACFATAAGEPTLTSLAGGGVLLYRDGGTGAVSICDFFANAPGLGRSRPGVLDFHGLDLHFGPARQRFHIGAGAAAVPGVIPGLCTALEKWGSLSLAEVIQPACRLLREGVKVGPLQEDAARVLEPILFRSEKGRRQFSVAGRLIRCGDRYRLPALAGALEQLADGEWRETYETILCQSMLDQCGPAAGGLIGPEDLAAYRVEVREPLRVPYRGATIYTNPPPAAGGTMIALMLKLLEQEPVARMIPGGAEHVLVLCRAMRVADEARLGDGNAAYPEGTARWIERFRQTAGEPLGVGPKPQSGAGSTTHISVIDGKGNAAAVTFSHGEGNGMVIGETGIMMNNLMGEEDLFPNGFHLWPPGTRLSTMMSPSLVVLPEGQIVVLGSGGANRIRTALTQVISLLRDFGWTPAQAVRAPRVHFEQGVLNAEIFDRPRGANFLEGLGARRLVCFDEPNLFFGGVHLVQRENGGAFSGAGDPRRGGVCRIN